MWPKHHSIHIWEEILTNAGYRVQRGWLWFLAAKFFICSIYRPSGTRLLTKGEKIILEPQDQRQNTFQTHCSFHKNKKVTNKENVSRTPSSSSSELKRLSRSLMETTRSVSWIRLVETMRLLAPARWGSAGKHLRFRCLKKKVQNVNKKTNILATRLFVMVYSLKRSLKRIHKQRIHKQIEFVNE